MISNYFLILTFLLNTCLLCSAKGPPFSTLPDSKALYLEGRFRFTIDPKLFYNNLGAELYLERSKSKKKKTYFTMRTFGKTITGDLRQKTYEGLAYRTSKGVMELRSERCYLHGKETWEDRLIPLERWDCDHLVFAYQSLSDFQRKESLKPIKTKETIYSNWFSPQTLKPMPAGTSNFKKPIYFAGQIIHMEQSPKTGLVIVWGKAGAFLLRNKQTLLAEDKTGKVIGKLKVLARPGDFVICKWKTPYKAQAKVAYAKKANYKSNFF